MLDESEALKIELKTQLATRPQTLTPNSMTFKSPSYLQYGSYPSLSYWFTQNNAKIKGRYANHYKLYYWFSGKFSASNYLQTKRNLITEFELNRLAVLNLLGDERQTNILLIRGRIFNFKSWATSHAKKWNITLLDTLLFGIMDYREGGWKHLHMRNSKVHFNEWDLLR